MAIKFIVEVQSVGITIWLDADGETKINVLRLVTRRVLMSLLDTWQYSLSNRVFFSKGQIEFIMILVLDVLS